MTLAQTNGTPGESTSDVDFISVNALCCIYPNIYQEMQAQVRVYTSLCVLVRSVRSVESQPGVIVFCGEGRT